MSEIKTPNQQGALAKRNAALQDAPKPMTLRDYIKSMEPEIAKALPKVMTPERFTRIALSAVSSTPKLAECTPFSFMGAMMQAAQLGLEPNTPLGQAYLIPYMNNRTGKLECQFQIGYKGLIDLAFRSGDMRMIQAHIVYSKDKFDFAYGLDSMLVHVPTKETDRGVPEWVYATFELANGGKGFLVESYANVMAHGKKYSKSFSSGPWQTDPEAMAKKTMLKALLKYAPLRSEFMRAVSADETVKVELDADMSLVPPMEIEGEAEAVNE